MADNDFPQKVLETIKKVPKGKVATYGQIAAMVSTPRAARVVGGILRSLPEGSEVPWQRIVSSSGMISIENLAVPKSEQAERLQEEGIAVEFRDGNYWVDLKKHLWKP